MNVSTQLTRLQRLTGLLAMFFLLIAGICLVDALLGGMKGRQSSIELIPDSFFQISGPMPPKTENLRGFVIEGEPEDGSVRLLPEEVFSGYWLGGSMWRGRIVVEPHAQPDTYTISVKDQFGEKQNPALVFSVRIWANQDELNAHSPSRLTRMSGLDPFVFVLGFVFCGLVTGAVNFMLGRAWQRHLAAHHCSEIHMLKRLEQGVEIKCDIRGLEYPVQPGVRATIYRPLGESVGMATVIALEKNDIIFMVDEPSDKVRLSDIVCLQTENPAVDPVILADQHVQASEDTLPETRESD